MRYRGVKLKITSALIMIVFLFTGCSEVQAERKGYCTVVMEDCKDVFPNVKYQEAVRGSDVTFTLTLQNGCMVSGADYEDCLISQEGKETVLTLKNVCYSTVVRLVAFYEYRTYFPNGGEGEAVREPVSRQGENTRTEPFVREGYVQTGWNTKADGSGEHTGFGSRCEGGVLYAEWKKETDEEEFLYTLSGEGAIVTGYRGQDEVCVLPHMLGGKKVRTIQCGAFANASFVEFTANENLLTIEKGAFENAGVERLTLFDNLISVSDESFAGCPIRTLYLNARRPPVYAGSYFSAFPDKCRRLFTLQGRKIVLFSGSSARYGYDSRAIDEAFPEYEVVNMGIYAYTNARPQLDIILQAMKEGDMLLEAPEFDAPVQQFCQSSDLDRFFYSLVETDYKLLTLLDLREYTRVFDSLNEYLYEHSTLEVKDYSFRAAEYDDEGNRTDYPSYNEYGDYVLKRPNSERDEMHRLIPADYTVKNITEERIEALNRELAMFVERGVDVLFTYAPRNRSSLTRESTKERIEETEILLEQTLMVPVISNIKDYLYSGVYFYEIDNHLSDEGVALRTDQLISDLTEWKKKETKKYDEAINN